MCRFVLTWHILVSFALHSRKTPLRVYIVGFYLCNPLKVELLAGFSLRVAKLILPNMSHKKTDCLRDRSGIALLAGP